MRKECRRGSCRCNVIDRVLGTPCTARHEATLDIGDDARVKGVVKGCGTGTSVGLVNTCPGIRNVDIESVRTDIILYGPASTSNGSPRRSVRRDISSVFDGGTIKGVNAGPSYCHIEIRTRSRQLLVGVRQERELVLRPDINPLRCPKHLRERLFPVTEGLPGPEGPVLLGPPPHAVDSQSSLRRRDRGVLLLT